MSKYFITAIGNAIIDILAFAPDDFLQENNLNKGSMTLIDENHIKILSKLKFEKTSSGGSAANSVVNLSSFNVNNAFIGNVGSGNYGDIFHEDLRKNGVDFYCKNKTRFGSTARSFIIISPDAQRTMCTYLGDASHIENQIDESAIINSQILYIEGYIWSQEPVISALKTAIKTAKENGVKFAFSLSDSFWVNNHKEDFLELAQQADIIFANEEEIKALSSSSEVTLDNIKNIAPKNQNLDIIITKSSKGATIFSSKEQKFYDIQAQKVDNVIDTTGAGDAFAAGYFYGLKNNFNISRAGQAGNLFASHVIQKIGGRLEAKDVENIKNQLDTNNNVE
ncbi:adenosine kinase [Rickettsiales bacterium]|nr:adenosine kinase [Rickettsiales bacterium]